MHKISGYILTKDSEKYLALVLKQLSLVADEIIVVDSGSTDNTINLVENAENTRLIYRPFDNFVMQRNFAAEQCSNDWVLFVDSDEILSDTAVETINQLKKNGFVQEAYSIQRTWIVLGKPIKCVLPIVSPDYPTRLFNKKINSFKENSNLVHETLSGYSSKGIIQGEIMHYTFVTPEELSRKLELYSELAARDLIANKRSINYFKYIFSPIASFIKYYFMKGGYRDGRIGLVLGKYAYDYVRLKYKKALILIK